jgi:hypothetical protein
MCHCYMYCYREKVKYVIPTDVVFNISALWTEKSYTNSTFYSYRLWTGYA